MDVNVTTILKLSIIRNAGFIIIFYVAIIMNAILNSSRLSYLDFCDKNHINILRISIREFVFNRFKVRLDSVR